MGNILIPGSGTQPVPINFALSSQDGSVLYIDGSPVVTNNQYYSSPHQSTGLIQLTPGLHTIDVEYFQGTGGASFDLQWDPTGGSSFVDIPGSAFSYTPTDVGGTYTGSNNLIGITTGLAPTLANNGGANQTVALLPGSPALGAGGPATTAGVGRIFTDLSAPIGASDTTIYVPNVALFPSKPGFSIEIDSEWMAVDAISTSNNSLTVTRGVNGTTAVGHAQNASIYVGNLLAYTNVSNITVLDPMTSYDTILDISNAAAIPQTGNYTIQIDNEQMTVLSVDALNNTITVNRGVDGTLVAAHNANTPVYLLAIGASDITIQVQNVTALNLFGTMIRIDQEDMLVTSVNAQLNTVTVARGFNGTTAVEHFAGAGIYLAQDQRGVFSSSPASIGAYSPGTWLVTDGGGGPGSASDVTLPYAVANAQNGDTISFATYLSGGTITISTALTLSHNVTINGLGASHLTISASPGLPSIPGLQYELDASNASSLVLNGNNVLSWNDESGNGNNFSPAIVGQDPVLVNNALNGLPTLEFYPNSTGTPLVGADNVNAQTVFIVDAVQGTTGFGDGIWGDYGVDISERLDDPSGGTKFLGSPNDGGNSNDYTNNGGGTTYVTEANSFDQNTTTVGALGTANILVATGNLTPAETQIGGGSYGTRYFDGDIAEVLVYDTVLTTAQRNLVEKYLSNKWLGTQYPVGSNQLFTIAPGTTATISNLTLANGYASVGGAIDNQGVLTLSNDVINNNKAGIAGGGVYNTGTLTVNNSTFSNNKAAVNPAGNNGTVSSGGGIQNSGTLTVSNSTFTANSARYGGGLGNSGIATVTTSTFNGNSAPISGGGIVNYYGSLTVSNSTLAYNTAVTGGGVRNYTGTVTLSNDTIAYNCATYGGGVFIGGSTTNLLNTIVAGNLAAGSSSDVNGTIAVADYDFFGTTTNLTITSGTGNQYDVATGLATSLASNGGPTQTLALEPGNPLITGGGSLTTVANATLSATSTAVQVQNAAAIALTAGSYPIYIGQEEMLVTNVNTATNMLTVIRGYNNTTAVSHAVGAGVTLATDHAQAPSIRLPPISVPTPMVRGLSPTSAAVQGVRPTLPCLTRSPMPQTVISSPLPAA